MSKIVTKTWKRRQRTAKYILLYQFFTLGTEFTTITSAIIPYLQELNAPSIPHFVGGATGAYFLSSMISALILGRLSDVTLNFRGPVLFLNVCTLVGSILYFIGYSPYLILVARLLCGSLDALIPLSFGEFGRIFSKGEFQSQMGDLMAAYAGGAAFGPILNLIPSFQAFEYGLLRISNNNLPGLLMTVFCIIALILSFLGLPNLSREHLKLETVMGDCKHEDDTEMPSHGSDVKGLNSATVHRSWWKLAMNLATRRDMIILFCGQIVWAYSLSSGKVFIPLNAVLSLGLNTKGVAICYLVAGLISTLSLLLVSRCFPKFSSVSVSIVAFTSFFIASSFSFLCKMNQSTQWLATFFFGISVIEIYIGWYFGSTALKSILSMRVSLKEQSFSQGCFSTAEYVTSVCASLTSGLVFRTFQSYCACMMVINVLVLVSLSAFYKTLNSPYDESQSKKGKECNQGESMVKENPAVEIFVVAKVKSAQQNVQLTVDG